MGAFKPAQNLLPIVESGSYFLADFEVNHKVLLNVLGIKQLEEESKARLIAASLFQNKKNPKKLIKSLCEEFGVSRRKLTLPQKLLYPI